MFGNIINKAQLLQLKRRGDIEIEPFHDGRMRLAHYPLNPALVLNLGDVGLKGNRKREILHDFSGGDEYRFEPNQYAVIEIDEFIKIKEGIVGHFVAASNLIEQGFGLTAGKLDPGYGEVKGAKQQVRFGIKNLKDTENIMRAGEKLAYIFFVDLRGLGNETYTWTDAELKLILSRGSRLARDSDDGVSHGDGSGEI